MTCPTCDRPRATATERAHVGGCTCAACLAACWGPPCEPADWRAMVADATRTIAALRVALDDAHSALRAAVTELEHAPCRDAPDHSVCLKCKVATDARRVLDAR